MANLEDLGEVMSIDLLIVGGGFSGSIAAIKAKEEVPNIDVLMVDKQTIGYAGKAPKTSGIIVVFNSEDDPDKFIEYHVKHMGMFLEDQELLHQYACETLGHINDLDRWGVEVVKDDTGKIVTVKNPFNGLWSYAAVDLNMLLPLRARARKLGVKMMDKIQVVDLLKNSNGVGGAVGFNIISGKFYIFLAKSVLLANGSANYRLRRLWCAGTGEGIAAAYRAGAEMRNAEFGNCCPDLFVQDTENSVDRRYIFNANNENISMKYEPVQEPDIPLELLLGIERELREGRGPLYEDTSKMPKDAKPMIADLFSWKRPHYELFFGRRSARLTELGYPSATLSESAVTLGKGRVTYRLHAELSPIKVDHNMKTTTEGLWAIGDICYGGSAMAGALAAPPARMRGSGLGFAQFSAARGAVAAGCYASNAMPSFKADYGEVKKVKDDIFTPLQNNNGYSPNDAITEIQKIIVPAEYNLRRTGERLKTALSKLEGIKNNISGLKAKDPHYLCKCNEVKGMVLCAEMTLRSALERTESRGWHYREDYPQRDDKNWLKWIIVRSDNSKMNIYTEDIPIHKYRYKITS